VVTFVAVYVALVLAISVGLLKLKLLDDCHLVTLPVFPVKVNTVELVPVQTVSAAPATVPPTDVGEIMIESTELFADEHTPLVTTAL